jgi:hypothetical protein
VVVRIIDPMSCSSRALGRTIPHRIPNSEQHVNRTPWERSNAECIPASIRDALGRKRKRRGQKQNLRYSSFNSEYL